MFRALLNRANLSCEQPLSKLRLACQLFLALLFTFPQLASAAALINGGMISGAISIVGEQDTHTFTANADENVLLRIVDTSNNSFYPRISLYASNGAYLNDYGGSQNVGDIEYTVATSGTYTVIVSDDSGNHDQTGNYTLQLTGTGITSSDNPGVG